MHRIYGTVTRVEKKKLKVKTRNGKITIPITAKTLNLLGKRDAQVSDVRKGDMVDAFIRVKPNGKIKPIRVRILQPQIEAPNSAELNSSAAELANAQWTAPEDLASDMGEAHSLSMVHDGQNNLYGVWYATSPNPGLYLKTRTSSGWTTPQLIFSTDWAAMPSLGIDGQGTLHLVWTGLYDEQYTRIYYAQGVFNATTHLYEWTQPTDISALASSGYTNFVYSAELVVTGGTSPIVHVVWVQQWCPTVGL